MKRTYIVGLITSLVVGFIYLLLRSSGFISSHGLKNDLWMIFLSGILISYFLSEIFKTAVPYTLLIIFFPWFILTFISALPTNTFKSIDEEYLIVERATTLRPDNGPSEYKIYKKVSIPYFYQRVHTSSEIHGAINSKSTSSDIEEYMIRR